MPGPLRGVRVIELAGLGPVPFCGQVLCDMGADVVRVDRVSAAPPVQQVLDRGRRSIAIDLKQQAGIDVVLRLVADADVLIEGFRPGVAERLGLGPEVCRAVNRRLVYGRMTGWGQDGPLAPAAGHIAARGTVVERDGVPHPTPAPRLARNPGAIAGPAVAPGTHTDEILGAAGYDDTAIADLRATRTVA